MSITVLAPGFMTSLQDAGRPGLMALGVGASGAFDSPALRLANALCGNAPGQMINVQFSGWFSTRDNHSGSGSISIVDGASAGGTVIAQQMVNLPVAPQGSQFAPWTQVSGTTSVAAGSTVSFVVYLDNDLNFDNAYFSFGTPACASPPLTITKTWQYASTNDRSAITVARGGSTIDSLDSVATASSSSSTDGTPVTVWQGEQITLTETLSGSNRSQYAAVLNCTGGGSLSGNVLTVDASGTPISCTFTNTGLSSNLSITKTNSIASGPSDLPSDSVTVGSTTNYVLTVTNNGPAPITGAIVRDTPQSHLNCPASNPVTITGDGVPAGSFTFGDLGGGTGIALGTLAVGQSAQLSFACTVTN